MALNFGEILGGIGAAMGGTAPQYVQNLKAGKQADMAAREKALYEDAAIGLQLVESGNLQGFYDLATDRMEQLRRFPDAVPNDTVRLMALAKLGMGGERAAIGQLHAELIAATKAGQVKGYLQAPEPVRGVEVAGEMRNPFSGEVMGPRAAPPVSLTSRQLEAQDMALRAGPVGSAEYNKTYGDYMNKATGTTVVVGNTTEGERTAGILADRLDFAQSQINDVLAMSPESSKPQMGSTALNAMGLTYLANISNPAERQIIEAAQLDMLDAALTLGTGAAYTREQLEGYRVAYFPQIGDTDQVITAKSARLNNLIGGAYKKAGRAAPEIMRSSTPAITGNVVQVGNESFTFPTPEAAEAFRKAIP